MTIHDLVYPALWLSWSVASFGFFSRLPLLSRLGLSPVIGYLLTQITQVVLDSILAIIQEFQLVLTIGVLSVAVISGVAVTGLIRWIQAHRQGSFGGP